jgi:hypothetical protein
MAQQLVVKTRDACAEFARLNAEVESLLDKLVALTTAQSKAYHDKNQEEFMRLDHELETTLGAKERAIGAIREHQREHGCVK